MFLCDNLAAEDGQVCFFFKTTTQDEKVIGFF